MSVSPYLRSLCALSLLAFCVSPGDARATEIPPGGVTLELLTREGDSEVRAGAHPDRLIQGIEFSDPAGAAEDPKDVIVDFPPGLSGNPSAVPACPRRLFDEALFELDAGCPPASQVGVASRSSGASESSTPLYSIESGPNEAVMFGALGFPPLKLIGSLRPGDLGLSMRLGDLGQRSGSSLRSTRLELWGIPADHQEGTSIPRRPLLTLPTRCDGRPLATTVSTHTWQQPERWVSGSGGNGHPLVGCAELPFEPSLDFSFERPSADTPSGIEIDVGVPLSQDPDGLASSQLQDASIALPEGMTISPGGAAGLDICSDAQLGIGTSEDPRCPASSRVGMIELEVPALGKPMRGKIYLGAERPGERFRLFVAAAAKGSQVKFAGSLQADPQTGRLTASLEDLPQASFEHMRLQFDGGAGALLATPLACGPTTTTATLIPYSTPAAQKRSATATIAGAGGSACKGAPPFAPTLSAGSTQMRPGGTTAFTATVRRQDAEQLPERLALALPPGMSAALGSVLTCSSAAATNGACPPATALGTTLAELGPGPEPARIQGDVFLTGPYRHAPFGLALTFQAKLGPFDLGTLSVRAALRIDPRSGQVSIVTDPLPTIFEGIPIRFQTLGLDLERHGFMRNPTSCVPTHVSATLSSAAGAIAKPQNPFAMRGCIALAFRPKLSLALAGAGELHPGGNPSLQIAARIPPRGANLRSLQLAFPELLKLDSSGLLGICSQVDAARAKCPKASRVGSTTARTPLLKDPMSGSLYISQPPDNGLPDLWATLEGEGIEVSLRGEIAVKDGRAEVTFARTPDFPLSSLGLKFVAGKRGLLELRGSPCKGPRAVAQLEGQNRMRVDARPRVGVRGCGN